MTNLFESIVPKTLDFIKKEDYIRLSNIKNNNLESMTFQMNGFKSIREMNDRIDSLNSYIEKMDLCYFVTLRNTNSKIPNVYYSVSDNPEVLIKLMPLDRYIYK